MPQGLAQGPSDHDDDLLRSSPQGTVYFNGTSYSGADIKVLIHLYGAADKERDTSSLRAENARALDAQILELDSKLSDLQSRIGALAHEGTPEGEALKTSYDKTSAERAALAEAVAQIDTSQTNSAPQAKSGTKVLAELQTISISTHRAKSPVRALGHVYPKGFARGDREIAGSMIFTVFDEHVLYQFLEAHASDGDGVEFTSAMLDQLPPVDILISFANEYGSVSRMTIYGVEFVDEGQVMSIEDMITENVTHFVARDLDPMRGVSQRKVDANGLMTGKFQMKRASSLLLESDHRKLTGMLDPFERFSRRHNPYL